MRFVLAFLIGIVGLIVGWLVAAFGTLILGSAFGLSDFEGERAMVAFFAAGPVGGLIGIIAAIWLWSRRSSAR
jgi:nitrate reductase gamma subunit